MKTTAGLGFESQRARHPSSSLSSSTSESRSDILTTLQAGPETFQKTETPLQKTETFREWLRAQGKTKVTIKEIIIYAKKYGAVLDNGDAFPLMSLSPRNKHHAMTALANLAKFTGRYDMFTQLRQRYNLKWSKGDGLASFERFFNDDLTFEVMLRRVKEMAQKLPANMAAIIKFDCMTGLRPSEAVESVRLINDKVTFAKYYNPERQALEHFRFPSVFLRHTKKAYISFVNPAMLDIVASHNYGDYGALPTWSQFRNVTTRKGLSMDMRFCRKIFASWLHRCGINSETIDFLQGRTSTSVLSNHYLTPNQDLKCKVLDAVNKLRVEIEK